MRVVPGVMLAAALLPLAAHGDVTESPRPQGRTGTAVFEALQPELRPATPEQRAEETETVQDQPADRAGFRKWVEAFRDRARERGIGADTMDAAFRDVGFNAGVVEKDRNQAEFVKPIWTYLDTAVSDARVRNGRAALSENARLLQRIEDEYGVAKEVVAAIWGLESAYGAVRGSIPTIEALATLAYEGRRAEFFEDQLMTALGILQSGDVSASDMTGSWAGAMGHTQFMPSSFAAHAVDGDGDGKRNIWHDDPTDALASTAAYLREFGWTEGQPWGVEVRLPEDFDYSEARRDNMRAPSAWADEGIVGVDGDPVPDHGPASILLPAGAEGAAFMIFDNFEVLEHYNTADAYVIGVGHLADRLRGSPPLSAGWPRADRPLGPEDRIELQERLTEAGFSTDGIDGKIGPDTISAVRRYQQARGLVPDGYASTRLLERLR